MSAPAINLVHIMRPPSRTLFSSNLRISFLRAWFFTALKVLFIAGLLSGTGLFATVEKNTLLLDSYVRGDFSAYQNSYLPQPVRHGSLTKIVSKIIITQNLEPRGPEIVLASDAGSVAGVGTEEKPD